MPARIVLGERQPQAPLHRRGCNSALRRSSECGSKGTHTKSAWDFCPPITRKDAKRKKSHGGPTLND